ncbi:HNH endonuclease [uncultured Deinococcus sp.]|uniref:HNH endonuclease n=1 Tax=uncultured Deinococcus sp. TaxID=158789 RepID=UPI0025D83B9C|nr:HNH endonuclease [uncultured Deinococcus sp.]
MARRTAPSSWPPPAAPPQVCALCGRAVPLLTEHHLVPRSRGRRRGLKPQELPTVQLCRACHQFLHRTFSNEELEREFHTPERLLEHDAVRRFVTWLRTQPATRAVRVR